ncbi:MAG: energy transducer TonB [Burkholderiales bacterium]|nr:energy transducer TonB [Burkholderiales bacterium]
MPLTPAAVNPWRRLTGFLAMAVADLNRALVLSALIHVVIVFGLAPMTPLDPRVFEEPQLPLEVVLVNTRTESRPLNPELLAQVNLDGGGTVDEPRQAKSPLPVSPMDSAAAAEAEARVQALERQTQEFVQRASADYSLPPPRPQPHTQSHPPSPTAAELAARSLEMARLAARIEQDWDAYQKRPRRMYVGARAVEFTFARYVEDWRLKVERIGNLNYPEAARRNKIYGSLVLTVSINADGTVESIHIDRSSGSRILDAAAVKIVEMAAPFAPFPEEMRAKVDILGITRTWTFTRSDQITSE